MPRRATPLTAATIATAAPGRYADGANLYLTVRAPELKWWTFRYRRGGRMREMGLGAAAGPTAITLKAARAKARKLFDQHRDGHDPLELRRAGIAAERVAAAKAVTFRQEAEDYIASHADGWRNARHLQQWQNTLRDYVYPVIGDLPVSAIDVALVLKVLRPIWSSKTETASRVRGRIELVLAAAKAQGHREGENPAAWKGNLDHLLPAPGKVATVAHHAALPYAEIGTLMAKLRQQEGAVARALEFLVLTGSRAGEVIGARWNEVNLRDKLWIVPAGRMKGGREHRVPLSARALEILGSHGSGPLFAGPTSDGTLADEALLELLRTMGYASATVHGFRSSFRDWAAEQTAFPSAVAELALAHRVGSAVEQAYQRSDLVDKRRQLAEAWARYCAAPAPKPGGSVVPLRRARR